MNSEQSWVLQVDSAVYEFLKRIPRPDAERIFITIESLPDNPFSGDIQKMKGEKDTWRKRVGVFRIFYELVLREKVINVFKVERRTSKTY